MDIREIARRAKVSTATVSRTINRVPTVDPQLAKRVWKVVEDLGYYPNTQARALVSGKSRIFGLVVSEITNPFFPEIALSFERAFSPIRLLSLQQRVYFLNDLRERIVFGDHQINPECSDLVLLKCITVHREENDRGLSRLRKKAKML